MFVQRANVVLEIEDESKQYYLDNGYNVIDDKGRVVEAAIPSDIGTLRKFYVEATAKIKKLEAEIAELKAKPAPKKKATKEVEVAE